MTVTTVKNRVFRTITLSLQIIAIIMYFVVPLILGSSAGLLWLIIGIAHTVLFAVVFFRNARTRTALSVIFMIVVIVWCLVFFLVMNIFVMSIELSGFGPMFFFGPFIIYFFTSLLAIIFALAGPRRFIQQSEV